MAIGQANAEPVAARGGTVALIYRWMAAVFVVLVLIQAFLGGRGFFIDPDTLNVHGRVGDASFLYALIHLILAGVGAVRGGIGRTSVILSAILLVLVFVQLNLGYSSEDSNTAAAWHLPNGVLIFGLTVANAMRLWARQERGVR
ncbi:MAG: hypothetical protein H0T49_01640 [Chloroflexia bacterium]|jgi:hypothetical protein|nr:hypothetical protein [Chloroflexia bacterium]